MACVLQAKPANTGTGSYAVHILAHPPDRRRRDLDNLTKAILDSLVHAKVIVDDGLIDRLVIERSSVRPPGYVFVTIEEMKIG